MKQAIDGAVLDNIYSEFAYCIKLKINGIFSCKKLVLQVYFDVHGVLFITIVSSRIQHR